MTVQELYRFHYRLRSLRAGWTEDRWKSRLDYGRFEHKRIDELSSGMQQRLRLLFACTTQCELLFLDEPSSYLDLEGKAWWKNLLTDALADSPTLCMIASNELGDLEQCDDMIFIER